MRIKLIYLFFIIYIGVTVNWVDAEEISQPIRNDAHLLGQNESGANIGIGQRFIVNKGDRISKFIMYFFVLDFERNRATDIIICDLRNSEGEVLETSHLKGIDCIKRAEATFNFTEHKNGTYIITCYLHNSKTSEYHYYFVHTNNDSSSYTDGTQYVSTGADPTDWSAWKPVEGDMMFKIPIISERDSSNKPSQSTRDLNNSSIAESATYEKPSTATKTQQPHWIFIFFFEFMILGVLYAVFKLHDRPSLAIIIGIVYIIIIGIIINFLIVKMGIWSSIHIIIGCLMIHQASKSKKSIAIPSS